MVDDEQAKEMKQHCRYISDASIWINEWDITRKGKNHILREPIHHTWICTNNYTCYYENGMVGFINEYAYFDVLIQNFVSTRKTSIIRNRVT
jgi:hypothetical protein